MPGQISSYASSSMPSQSHHELEDEVCKDEIHDDVPSRMREMTVMEDDSHGSHVLSTIPTEIHGCCLTWQSSHACGLVHRCDVFILEFVITL